MTAVAARDLEHRPPIRCRAQDFEGAGPYAQLLADPSIDAVHIAVPNDFMDVGPKATRETLASRLPAAVR